MKRPLAAFVTTSSSRCFESACNPLTPVAVGGLRVGLLAARRVSNVPAKDGGFADRGRNFVALMAPEKHTRLARALWGRSFSALNFRKGIKDNFEERIFASSPAAGSAGMRPNWSDFPLAWPGIYRQLGLT